MRPEKRLPGQERSWKYVKVGISVNPEQRRRQFQTALPFGLKIINTYKYADKREARHFEKKIHREYQRYMTKKGGTEWFYVSNRVLNDMQLDLSRHDHSLPKWEVRILDLLYRLFGGKYTEQVTENSTATDKS